VTAGPLDLLVEPALEGGEGEEPRQRVAYRARLELALELGDPLSRCGQLLVELLALLAMTLGAQH
jgi:hypothetical protein